MEVTRRTSAKARSEWIRIGTPSSERNCFGCGPAIRVPRPAAGRIANTCITRRVYNLASGDGSGPCEVRRGEKNSFLRLWGIECSVPQFQQRIITMRKLPFVLVLWLSLFASALCAQTASAPSSEGCGKLASLALQNVSITSAKAYAAGAFVG